MRKQSHRFQRNAEQLYQQIDADIRNSFSTKQEWEIKKALNNAIGRPSRKLVDIRFSLPLLFSRYFFVLFIGRDMRRTRRTYELSRALHMANIIFGAFLLTCLISFAAVALLALLYFIKCQLGIDIFPNIHLSDILHMIF